jgi:hypothetical protein
MPDRSRDLPHLYLPDSGESEKYTSPRQGSTPRPPSRDRGSSGGDKRPQSQMAKEFYLASRRAKYRAY